MAIMDFKASVAINVTQADTLEKLLVSLRFVQGTIKGDFPLWRHPILVVGLFTAGVIGLLYSFFGTELGAALRATGSNPSCARAQGINTDYCKVLGLMISNGLVALSGALLCQYNGSNEINVGRGAIVIGLAAVIIGQVLFGKLFHNFASKLFAVSVGAILYYIVIQAVLAMGMNPNYLKLLSALVVAVFLSIPYWKGKYFHAKVKRGGARHA
jgi:putative ABC transport system permease protein